MITRAKEMQVSVREKLFGGVGSVKSAHFLRQEDASGVGRNFGKCTLAPGDSIGYHSHSGDFEVYFILAGTARVNDNGSEHFLHPGDSMLTRNGEAHSLENAGDTDLEYIAIILFDQK